MLPQHLVIMIVISYFPNITSILDIYQLRVCPDLLNEFPSGNLVDGLPLVVNTGAGHFDDAHSPEHCPDSVFFCGLCARDVSLRFARTFREILINI